MAAMEAAGELRTDKTADATLLPQAMHDRKSTC